MSGTQGVLQKLKEMVNSSLSALLQEIYIGAYTESGENESPAKVSMC